MAQFAAFDIPFSLQVGAYEDAFEILVTAGMDRRKIKAFITDNAANMKAARQKLSSSDAYGHIITAQYVDSLANLSTTAMMDCMMTQ